jgi:hypothetical protein
MHATFLHEDSSGIFYEMQWNKDIANSLTALQLVEVGTCTNKKSVKFINKTGLYYDNRLLRKHGNWVFYKLFQCL